MQEGNNHAATKLLGTALLGIKKELDKPKAPKSAATVVGAVRDEESDDCGMKDETPKQWLHSISILSSEPWIYPRWRDENIFSFYARAFTIDETSHNQENATVVAVVVLYNLALINHFQALEKNESPSELLHAAGLYKAAQEMACTGWDEDTCLDMYCLLLALATNLGHIHGHSHHQLLDFCKTRDCLNSLIGLLTSPQAPLYLSENDFEFFYTEVVIFQELPALIIAPAA